MRSAHGDIYVNFKWGTKKSKDCLPIPYEILGMRKSANSEMTNGSVSTVIILMTAPYCIENIE